MTTVMNDIKFGIRQLIKSPGFTTMAILTLTLCVAANIVIFAVTDAILIRSLPFPQANRLVIAYQDYPSGGFEHQGCALATYYDWRETITAFASTAASRSGSVAVSAFAEQETERVLCERVSPEFFDTLDVKPALGRFFTEEETDPARSGVAVLTDTYWRKHYHADPNVLGHAIQVDGQLATIVGVLRPNFRYLSSRAQLFFPLASAPHERAPQARHNVGNAQIIARLAPDISLTAAQAQIEAFNAQQMKMYPSSMVELLENAGFHAHLYPLHADHVRSVRPVLLWLQGGALFLLLIGSVNLINLLLIRASSRTKDFSIRQALGACRHHVARAVLIETLLITGAGGLLGLTLGSLGISALSQLGTTELPLGVQISFNSRVAITAVGGSLLVGIAFAVPIVGFHLRKQLATALHVEDRCGTIGPAAQRLRYAFIVTQITLAFVLLTGAGLFGVSLQRVLQLSPGFQAQKVLTGRVGLPSVRYGNPQDRLAFTERLLSNLRVQPGVTSAAISTVVPFSGQDNSQAIVPEGFVPQPGDSIRSHFHCATSGEFWQAMGIPLRQGRFLEDADNHRDQRVCVIDEVFAQRYWADGEVIGKRLAKGPAFNESTAYTIVGVVGQVKQGKLEEIPLGSVYFPYRDDAADQIYLVTRSSLAPLALASTLRQTVQRLDPQIPVDDIHTMQARIDTSLIQRRSPALLAGVFAGVALLLTALGTYGVVAYAVTQRRREIGIRMALGALPQQVLTHFLGISVRLLVMGLILGVLGAWAVGHVMQRFLFGISATHVGVLAMTTGVMLAVVLLACLIPALRAAKVDPMEALRYE
jgi:predicted permease